MGFLNLRFLINLVLVALPVGTTLGILMGVQEHRHATGQKPLFYDPDDGGDDGKPPVNNDVTDSQYCQKSYGFTPETKGQEYTFNPNQWGWDEGEEGELCVDVSSFNNRTYATDTTAPEFSITWEYPRGPESQPVHAFPNVKVDGDVFPATLSSITKANVALEWTYAIGNKTATTKTDEAGLTKHDVNTNVAIDMFMDSDKTKAQDSAKANFEVMVWFAAIGAATQPIGMADGAVLIKKLGTTEFSLYYGQNGQDQYVLTWLASDTTDTFSGDISPLLDALTSSSKKNFPSASDYLGYMALGTEALSSDTTVTFHCPTLSIDIQTQSST